MPRAAAVSSTMTVEEVTMPRRCASRTPWLTPVERPKSSALTMRRRSGTAGIVPQIRRRLSCGMPTRGVRGATTVERNDPAAVRERTGELMRLLVASNGILPEDVASVLFTVTEDVDADFPALAVRSMPGWEDVPLLCAREIPVPGALEGCIRVLLLWNTDQSQSDVRHAFVRGARELRPAWAVRVPGDEGGSP